MKKKMNYFNREERNGMILLLFCLLLFVSFVFMQKRFLVSDSEMNIVYQQAEFSTSKLNPEHRTAESKSAISIDIKKDTMITKTIKKITRIDAVQSDFKLGNEIMPIANPTQKKTYADLKNRPVKNTKNYDFNQSESKLQSKVKSTFKVKEGGFSKRKFRKKIKPFSINTQDQETWKSLYGIGPKYAERIIKYQKWLGGFHSIDQLKEVYGITDSLFQQIEPFLVEDKPFKTFDINTVNLDELGRHPYIYWDQAKLLINYRKHHGDFQSVEDLYKIKELDKEQVQKLLPYINFGVAGIKFQEDIVSK